MQKTVQLYRYNASEIDIQEGDEAFFETQFIPEDYPDFTMWLNFHSMAEKESIIELCNRLGIDKLIQEDLFMGTKRPRLEEYPEYVFFTIVSALPIETSDVELRKERVSFVLGKNFLISFQQKKSDHFPNVRDRLIQKRGKIRYQGPDFLLYRMLEAIIDNYMEVTEEIGLAIEKLDKLVIRTPKSDVLRKIEMQKRKLVDLRKTVLPMRELLIQLERVENQLFHPENRHYFLELKDSCFGCTEEIDAQKQILEGIANLYYAIQGQRMNEIMKVLTVISAIFIPLTFIVGVYGMNFENMPELQWKYGYFFTWGVMILLSIILMFVFYKRGWLKRND